MTAEALAIFEISFKETSDKNGWSDKSDPSDVIGKKK